MQESYVWLCAAARLPSAGCTICVGRSTVCVSKFVRRRALKTPQAAAFARATLPRPRCFWEGCSSLSARSGCTLGVLRQEFHHPRCEAVISRTICVLLHERQLHGRANS